MGARKREPNDISEIDRPGMTIESRQSQLTALATNLAEQQLRDGTASPSVIVHFLKLGTVQAQLEIEKLKADTILSSAKADAYSATADHGDKLDEVLRYMRMYRGEDDASDESR